MLTLLSSLDLDGALGCILEQIQRVIPCRAVALVLAEGDTVYVAHQRGLEDVCGTGDGRRAGFSLDAFPLPTSGWDSPLPTVIADTVADPEWWCPPGFEWVRSFAVVPMQAGARTLGFLALFDDLPGTLDREAGGLLEAFAVAAAVAFQRARLDVDERRARHAAQVLSEASLALTQTFNLQAVMDTLLAYIGQLVPYDRASVLMRQDDAHLVVRAVRGNGFQCRQEPLGTIVDVSAHPHIAAVLQRQESILISDTCAYPGWTHHSSAERARNWLGVPLLAGSQGGVIGLCELSGAEPGIFTSEHTRLVQVLVAQAAVAIQNAWLFDQVRAGRERLRQLSQRLVEAQEAERRYLARELHDEAGQALTSLLLGLDLLERDAHHPQAVIAQAGKLRSLVDGVLENLHRLAIDLRPASLDQLGLAAALQQYVEGVHDRYGLVARFEAVGFDARLPLDVETALYRIVQEAVTNVVRHARATCLDVLLARRGDKLVVVVEDNGTGFDPTAAAQKPRLGLLGMHERTEMLGGTLVVESGSTGTTLVAEVPGAYSYPDRGRSWCST